MLPLLVKREIDLPLVRFGLKSFVIFILATATFLFPGYSLYFGIFYLGFYFYFIGRVITMYHDMNHYPPFKNKLLNTIFIQGLGLLYGFTPFTYFSHHIMMHHPENNEFDDLSSTLTYQRDSFRSFILYYLRFFFSVFGVRKFLIGRKSKKMRQWGNWAVAGECLFLLMVGFFTAVAPIASIFVFIFPYFITRTLLIMGNWGEHAFIDPLDYQNLYKSSTNIVGKYNNTHFNVGYHIGHHLLPSRHYTELENEFYDHIDQYGKEDAMVLRDMHYPHIWYYLMMKNYQKLAAYFVQLPHAPARSTEQIINLMKTRTQAIRYPDTIYANDSMLT